MATVIKQQQINWLFPEPGIQVTIEEYREHIREAECSESMTFYEFTTKMKEWLKTVE
ncbi:hypothetical protein FACS1894176_01800 [Bacteroidia bacterium]|nr:hypothetical protein FACS1894176_01800 [Bacteroidia bacterium]